MKKILLFIFIFGFNTFIFSEVVKLKNVRYEFPEHIKKYVDSANEQIQKYGINIIVSPDTFFFGDNAINRQTRMNAVVVDENNNPIKNARISIQKLTRISENQPLEISKKNFFHPTKKDYFILRFPDASIKDILIALAYKHSFKTDYLLTVSAKGYWDYSTKISTVNLGTLSLALEMIKSQIKFKEAFSASNTPEYDLDFEIDEKYTQRIIDLKIKLVKEDLPKSFAENESYNKVINELKTSFNDSEKKLLEEFSRQNLSPESNQEIENSLKKIYSILASQSIVIKGVVKNKSGEFIKDAGISLEPLLDDNSRDFRGNYNPKIEYLKADNNGEFSTVLLSSWNQFKLSRVPLMGSLPRSNYILSVSAKGYKRKSFKFVNVNATSLYISKAIFDSFDKKSVEIGYNKMKENYEKRTSKKRPNFSELDAVIPEINTKENIYFECILEKDE